MARGRTLKPLLQDPTLEWDYPAFTFRQNMSLKSVQYGQLHLIEYPDGTQELYDQAIDPSEWTNLVADLSYAD